MKRSQLKLDEFISPKDLTEDVSLLGPKAQLDAYKKSMWQTISQMNTLIFQLASYNNPDKEQFQAQNSAPLISRMIEIYSYFDRIGQHNFSTLADYNLNEFRRSLTSGTRFIPKYSWNPFEDKTLGQQYSSSSPSITPAEASPYRLPERNPGGNPGTVRKLSTIETPIAQRIQLDRK